MLKTVDHAVIGLVFLCFSAHASSALPQSPPIDLAPHRAIYDMNLREAGAGSNVSDIKGRLVFDFEGSTCAGFTLTSRLVTQMVDRDGNSTLSDLRSTTWENASGDKFRFENSQYIDRRLSEQVTGQAARRKTTEAIDVTLDKPQKHRLKLKGPALFPTQHSIAILEAAQQGAGVLQADVYDGSEQGKKLLQTTTFIGRPSVASRDARPGRIANTERLDGLVSWPISISYYDPAENPAADEGLPTYEMSFRLFANGVSEELLINYGGFSITGDLSRIEFHASENCSDKKR